MTLQSCCGFLRAEVSLVPQPCGSGRSRIAETLPAQFKKEAPSPPFLRWGGRSQAAPAKKSLFPWHCQPCSAPKATDPGQKSVSAFAGKDAVDRPTASQRSSVGAGPARKDVLGGGHPSGCADGVQHTKTLPYPHLPYAFISKMGEMAALSLLRFQPLCVCHPYGSGPQ